MNVFVYSIFVENSATESLGLQMYHKFVVNISSLLIRDGIMCFR